MKGEAVLGWRGLLGWLSLAALGVLGAAPAGDVLTVASLVALGVLVLLLCRPVAPVPVVWVRVRAQVLRERARRSAFLRTRDPDADGRVRPRAPGQRLVA